MILADLLVRGRVLREIRGRNGPWTRSCRHRPFSVHFSLLKSVGGTHITITGGNFKDYEQDRGMRAAASICL
jgi:hypothetical protein